jgi:hypothetical protein
MADVRGKYVAPAICETAFSCPHCGTLTTQTWFALHARALVDDGKATTPPIIDLNWLAEIEAQGQTAVPKFIQRLAAGEIWIATEREEHYVRPFNNAAAAVCRECDQVSIWLHHRLLWPSQTGAPIPNSDLPAQILADYEEAGSILRLSPRGAAALLRLAVQKLCKHLGEKGKNLDDDIGSLVKKGLDDRVRQALDIVRVIGNNAVHPGQIDLRDNRDTAEQLFKLVNLIAEKMISEPKHVAEMYDTLPEGARKAIEKRDS